MLFRAMKADLHAALVSLPLRHFLEVARTGSVSQAAQHLHVAASAVSRQLSKLEGALGVALFERQVRGMQLTLAGERLLQHVAGLETDSEHLVPQLLDLGRQAQQRVRLACTEGFAAGLVPRCIAAYREVHPGTQFQLRVESPAAVSALLLRSEVDLALRFSLAPEPGVAVLHASPAPVFALMVPSHPLAGRARLGVRDVADYPVLTGEPHTTGRQLFDLACALEGLHCVPAMESNVSSALLPMLGPRDVALASYATAAHWVEAGRLVARPLSDAPLQQRQSQLLARQGAALAPGAAQFAQALVRALQQAQPPRARTAAGAGARKPRRAAA